MQGYLWHVPRLREYRVLRRLAAVPALAYGTFRRLYWSHTYAGYNSEHKLPRSFFNGLDTIIYGGGKVIAGEGSYVGRHCTICVQKGTNVEIGEHVSIAPNVRIDTTSAYADQNRSVAIDAKVASVKIGPWVWIGVNAYIGPGVTIGANSVIAANSVVVRDVEPNVIVRPAALVVTPQRWPGSAP